MMEDLNVTSVLALGRLENSAVQVYAASQGQPSLSLSIHAKAAAAGKVRLLRGPPQATSAMAGEGSYIGEGIGEGSYTYR